MTLAPESGGKSGGGSMGALAAMAGINLGTSSGEDALDVYKRQVPDNLKSAVTRSDRNEPVINEEFAAFAEHYGCCLLYTSRCV